MTLIKAVMVECEGHKYLVAKVGCRGAGANEKEDAGQRLRKTSPADIKTTHHFFPFPTRDPPKTLYQHGRVYGGESSWARWPRAAVAACSIRLGHSDDPREPVHGHGRVQVVWAPPNLSAPILRERSADAEPPSALHGGPKVPGGDGRKMEKGLVGGEDDEKDAFSRLMAMLEKDLQQVEERDAELRARLPAPKKIGRKRAIYPPPYLGAAAILYEAGYSYREVSEAVNRLLEPKHRINEETLRNRLVEAGVKLRSQAEAVRRATLRGPRQPPRDTIQMAMAAALAQGDAAVRVKGKTMVEMILNTPYEGFARTVAKLFEGHGTISLGARKYTEDYYEWQLIIRFDLKDWQFLIEAKNSMRIPDFITTDEELRAYLAMMLACEGYITWKENNKERTNNTTTTFFVSVITNTNKRLIHDIEARLRERDYTVSRIIATRSGEVHIDRYGRVYETQQDGQRLQLYVRQEVRRFLEWLGRIPHPTKEAQRLVTLRLLREYAEHPIRWRQIEKLRDRLQFAHEKAAELGRQRAKHFFDFVQAELEKGRRRDTRPLKAQTASHHIQCYCNRIEGMEMALWVL
ncbi:hypothetical protein HRbin02_01430 [Candidatus Calditenuaceae archaeon HR02]|nr:hypothetical protein HRbin02_01430 [Candidatus Calditenuaceae archaeon HR02]